VIGEVPIGRVVTRAIVAALCVAAGMACIALLRGDFDETDWKVIATSLLFAVVSAAVRAECSRLRRLAAAAEQSSS